MNKEFTHLESAEATVRKRCDENANAIRCIVAYLKEQSRYGFYQLCPKCDGQKTVSRPPGTPADVRPCSSWEASYPCDICKGEGVIPRPEIKNMQP